ncbi:MAG: thioredoxin family protein, partial [Luteimonas sp.]
MAFTRIYLVQEPARAEIDTRSGDTLLEFGAPWCGHCIAAQASIEAALAARKDVAHLKIEDGRGKPLGRSFKVKLW